MLACFKLNKTLFPFLFGLKYEHTHITISFTQSCLPPLTVPRPFYCLPLHPSLKMRTHLCPAHPGSAWKNMYCLSLIQLIKHNHFITTYCHLYRSTQHTVKGFTGSDTTDGTPSGHQILILFLNMTTKFF